MFLPPLKSTLFGLSVFKHELTRSGYFMYQNLYKQLSSNFLFLIVLCNV